MLPVTGVVLEVASGTGQHAEHFARALPSLTWQPSESDAAAREELAARVRDAALANLREPVAFDVHDSRAPLDGADAVICINMIHIAPWSACEALLRHAGQLLPPGSPLVLYGPFMRHGEHTAPSNATFDASLRARNPQWGVRDLDEVSALARRHGFGGDEIVPMPANNLSVIFRK
jgi:cyclopropane fatty-acyl-phospholipid synthase-like methyltransferase